MFGGCEKNLFGTTGQTDGQIDNGFKGVRCQPFVLALEYLCMSSRFMENQNHKILAFSVYQHDS